jgi:hypothetical protein
MNCTPALSKHVPATASRVAAGSLAPVPSGRGTSKKITTIKST